MLVLLSRSIIALILLKDVTNSDVCITTNTNKWACVAQPFSASFNPNCVGPSGLCTSAAWSMIIPFDLICASSRIRYLRTWENGTSPARTRSKLYYYPEVNRIHLQAVPRAFFCCDQDPEYPWCPSSVKVSRQQQTLNYIDSAGSDAMSSLSPETSNGEAGSTKQSYWNGRGYDNCEEHFQSNVLYSAKAKTNAHDTCQNTNQIAIVKHETDRFWEELTRAPLVILKHVRTTWLVQWRRPSDPDNTRPSIQETLKILFSFLSPPVRIIVLHKYSFSAVDLYQKRRFHLLPLYLFPIYSRHH